MRRGALVAAVAVGLVAVAAGGWAAVGGPAVERAFASPLRPVKAPPPLRLREKCVTRVERRRVVRFRAIDGVRLIGVELGRGPRGVVLAHSAYAQQNLCSWMPYGRTLARAGYRVLVFDQRSFGSSGDPSHWRRQGQVDWDVLGAIRTLRARGAKSIVLAGASLGGAAVLSAAAQAVPAVDGVISFSSPQSYVRVNALAAVQALRVPVLFLAAEDDGEYANVARMLYEACASAEKRLEIVPGHVHGEGLWRNSAVRPLVDAFIARHSAP
ncbi:MAG TPA: alpha/beta fold hydrolase [Gaiellaceae bacterium]|nr:alpha/beta fold hydrolase [Gaiellaceae bacterium]